MNPTIYLFFDGRCLEAMSHYADVLGGRIEDVMRNADAPDPASRMPGGDDVVMNMSLRLGSATIMASDSPAGWYRDAAGLPGPYRERRRGPSSIGGASSRLWVAGAREVAMPPGETFWAERFTMFTDR